MEDKNPGTAECVCKKGCNTVALCPLLVPGSRATQWEAVVGLGQPRSHGLECGSGTEWAIIYTKNGLKHFPHLLCCRQQEGEKSYYPSRGPDLRVPWAKAVAQCNTLFEVLQFQAFASFLGAIVFFSSRCQHSRQKQVTAHPAQPWTDHGSHSWGISSSKPGVGLQLVKWHRKKILPHDYISFSYSDPLDFLL